MTSSRTRIERIAVPLLTALTALIGAAIFAVAVPSAFGTVLEDRPTTGRVSLAQSERGVTTTATVATPGCPAALTR